MSDLKSKWSRILCAMVANMEGLFFLYLCALCEILNAQSDIELLKGVGTSSTKGCEPCLNPECLDLTCF